MIETRASRHQSIQVGVRVDWVRAGGRMRILLEMGSTAQEIIQRREPDSNINAFGYGSLIWHQGVEHSTRVRAFFRAQTRCRGK